jgi:hypothetical protein
LEFSILVVLEVPILFAEDDVGRNISIDPYKYLISNGLGAVLPAARLYKGCYPAYRL